MRHVLAVLLVLTGCQSEVHLAPPVAVASVLAGAVRAREAGVNLSAVATGFTWDTVVFLAPYTPRVEAERAIGFPWPEYSKFHLDQSDSFYLIVFLSQRSIARVETIRRCEPDVSVALCGTKVLRAHSHLTISYASPCASVVAAN